MLNCNTYTTNAPIICNEAKEAVSYADKFGKQLIHLEPDAIVQTLQQASKEGAWCLLDCSTVESDSLRDAVAAVWLQGNWDHHTDFRAWFIHESFLTPLTTQFSLDNTISGFTLSPARGSSVATRLRVEAANAHLPLSLVAGAVYLKYTDNFEDEFNVRSLVNAVGNSQLFYTKEYRRHIRALQPRHVLGLFRLATREDIFVALAEQGQLDEDDREMLISCRNDAMESLIDIAFKKEFIEGATVLRDLGCCSDAFDFNDLLKPSFAKVLRVILQPDRPFPFDPKATVSYVARQGNAEVLQRLFQCRIDLHFEYSDYPVADACVSRSDEVVWIVLDRMGVTGVNPLTEPRWALYHLMSVLRDTADEGVQLAARRRSTTVKTANAYPETSLALARRFLKVLEAEGQKVHIPVGVIARIVGYPDIMQSLMELLDPHAEPNAPALLEFFAEFDPDNEHMEEMVRRGFREMPQRLGGRPLEVEVFTLLWHLLEQGHKAHRMFIIAVDCTMYYGYLDFTYPGDAGETLLHKAIQCEQFDCAAVGYALYRMSVRDRVNFCNAEDGEGRGGVMCLATKAISDLCTVEEEATIADAVRLLLGAGATIGQEQAARLYTRCIDIGYSQLAFELMQAARRTMDFSVLPSSVVVGIVARYRLSPKLDEDRFKVIVEMASDCLTLEEVHAFRMSVGSEKHAESLMTTEIDPRMLDNTLPFKCGSREQQIILSKIVDFLDLPSFNGFHDLCYATHVATVGRERPAPPPFRQAGLEDDAAPAIGHEGDAEL